MKNDLFNLESEVAVVLGGTGVLCGAMAEALAAFGARVAVLGRNEERGNERVRAIEAAGGRAVFQPADAMSRDSLARARDAVVRQWGSVTVLVNGAGGNKPAATVAPGGDFCKLPLEGWQDVFDLNLVGGCLLPCQVFGEVMVASGRGSVINIASMSSILPLSRVVAYSASKAAVLKRQLIHVGYKIAAQMGDRYLRMLEACEPTIARNVTGNLYERHVKPLFVS